MEVNNMGRIQLNVLVPPVVRDALVRRVGTGRVVRGNQRAYVIEAIARRLHEDGELTADQLRELGVRTEN